MRRYGPVRRSVYRGEPGLGPFMPVLAPFAVLLIISLCGAFWTPLYYAWFAAAGWVALTLAAALLICGANLAVGVIRVKIQFPSPPDWLNNFSVSAFLSIGVAFVLLTGSCFVNAATWAQSCAGGEGTGGPRCEEKRLNELIEQGDYTAAGIRVLPIVDHDRYADVLYRYQNLKVVNKLDVNVRAIVTSDEDPPVPQVGSYWVGTAGIQLAQYDLGPDRRTFFILKSKPVDSGSKFTVIAWDLTRGTIVYKATFTAEELERLGWAVTIRDGYPVG